MLNPGKIVLALFLACFVFSIPSIAAGCEFSLSVADPSNTGLADAARERIVKTLDANGCHEEAEADLKNPLAPSSRMEPMDSGSTQEHGVRMPAEADLKINFTINEVDADRKFNAIGLLLAGGYSSATKLNVTAAATLEAEKGGEKIFSETITFRNSPHELFSGWRKARAVKKRAVEDAADRLVVRLLENINNTNLPAPSSGMEPVDTGSTQERGAGMRGSASIKKPPRSIGDFLNEDRDFWPIFSAAFADIAIHESGHFFNARLTGHSAHMQGNDSRTFEVGPHTVLGLSALFTHHVGDDQLFMMPDVLYDFGAAQTPSGLEYLDANGAPVSHGRRDHALIAYSGILFQNLANEAILTRHPRLIDEDNPFLKGMVFFNLFIPAFYTFEGRSDFNSDLRMLQQDLGYDKWAVNAMVLAPAALDFYRYYHPEKKRIRAYARIAKIVPVIICLSK